MAGEFIEFVDRVNRTDNHVDDLFVQLALKYEGPQFGTDRWRVALYGAGLLLKTKRSKAFVTSVIPEELWPEEATVASTAMMKVLNLSLSRHASSGRDQTFTNHQPETIASCSMAERLFGHLFSDMELGINEVGNAGEDGRWSFVPADGGWSLITGSDNVLGIQKMAGEDRTVLGFEPLVIDGIEFPAGSLYAAQMPPHFRSNTVGRKAIAGRHVSGLAFARLTPWAYPPAQRRAEFPRLMDENHSTYVREATLAELQALTLTALPYSEPFPTNTEYAITGE